MGHLTGSRFQLKVSLRYAPEPGELDFLCELFRIASGILSDATDGALAIGQVDIASDSAGGADADIWIHPEDTVWPNSTDARLWIPGQSLDFAQSYLMYPTVLVHELGHYLFGLRDEYGSGARCIGKISRQASLMESYGWGNYTCWTTALGDGFFNWPSFFAAYMAGTAVFTNGQPSEFCHAGNHDPNAAHRQNTANGGQSCWTYMANDANHHDIPYGLTLPPAAGPRSRRPAAPLPPVCVELQGLERDLLILGPQQPSVGGEDLAAPGAAFWIDTAPPGDQLGVTSGAGEPTLGPPFSTVPLDAEAREGWRETMRRQTAERTDASIRPNPDGLRSALLAVAAPGRAGTQQAVLVASWLSEADVDAVLRTVPDLLAGGTRLQVVARGDEAGLGLLAQAAHVTGGSLVVSGPEEGPASGPSAALIELGEGRREHASSLPRIEPGREPEPEAVVGRPAVRFEIPVSPGSTQVTLGALWPHGMEPPSIDVMSPDGRPVHAGTGPAPSVGPGGRPLPYAIVTIERPEPGSWNVVVSGPTVSRDTIRPIASEVNERFRLEASVAEAHVRLGEPIELRARLRGPMPLPGASVSARVRTPAGDVVEVAFREHRGEGDDPHEAATYTATFDRTDVPGAYTIEVEAHRSADRFRSSPDAYYAKRPRPRRGRRVLTTDVPEIHRRAVLSAVADAAGRTERDPLAGFSPRRSPVAAAP